MSSGTQRQHRNTFGVLVQLLGAGEGSKCIQESQGDVWVGKRNYLGIVQWIFCWLSGGKEESEGTEEFFCLEKAATARPSKETWVLVQFFHTLQAGTRLVDA